MKQKLSEWILSFRLSSQLFSILLLALLFFFYSAFTENKDRDGKVLKKYVKLSLRQIKKKTISLHQSRIWSSSKIKKNSTKTITHITEKWQKSFE